MSLPSRSEREPFLGRFSDFTESQIASLNLLDPILKDGMNVIMWVGANRVRNVLIEDPLRGPERSIVLGVGYGARIEDAIACVVQDLKGNNREDAEATVIGDPDSSNPLDKQLLEGFQAIFSKDEDGTIDFNLSMDGGGIFFEGLSIVEVLRDAFPS